MTGSLDRLAATEGFSGEGRDTDRMERNVGGTDRTARIVVGLALAVVAMATVAFGASLGSQVQLIVAALALLVGAVLLATAGAQSCPVNSLLGRDTSRRESRL